MSYILKDDRCCGYGGKGDNTRGYDCIIIPGAENVIGVVLNDGSRFCGRRGGLITDTNNAITPASVCCK
jgi:hypothetical protein